MKKQSSGQNKNEFGLNITEIRSDFPMLKKKVKGRNIIYFDSAASSHKPAEVIRKLEECYLEAYAKPNEEHAFSKVMTNAVEGVRSKAARLLNAKTSKSIIFTRGTTEGINIVA